MATQGQRTLRWTVALWVFVAAQVPSTIILVTTSLSLEPRPLLAHVAALGPLILMLSATSALFAWIVSTYVVGPLTRVRALAVLAPNPGVETPGLRDAALREPYAETAAVLRALEVMHSRARDEVSRRDQLASFIAHDLRTPIAAVAMQLGADSEAPDACRDELQRVLMDIDQLVEALRSGHDRVALVREGRTDVERVVRSTIEGMTVRDGVELSVSVIASFMTAMPESALRSVVQNLVSNAVRHAASVVSVEVSRGLVQVFNDGSPGRHDPDERQAEPGTVRHGLGLAIARHSLSTFRGHLRVDDRHGHGFVAIAYLPLAGGDQRHG